MAVSAATLNAGRHAALTHECMHACLLLPYGMQRSSCSRLLYVMSLMPTNSASASGLKDMPAISPKKSMSCSVRQEWREER